MAGKTVPHPFCPLPLAAKPLHQSERELTEHQEETMVRTEGEAQWESPFEVSF